MVLSGDKSDQPTDAEFLGVLKTLIPAFMIPKTIEWVEHMPIGPNGKIDRGQLKKQISKRYSNG